MCFFYVLKKKKPVCKMGVHRDALPLTLVSSNQAFTATEDLLVAKSSGPFSIFPLDCPMVRALPVLPFLGTFFSFVFHSITFFGFSFCLWGAV